MLISRFTCDSVQPAPKALASCATTNAVPDPVMSNAEPAPCSRKLHAYRPVVVTADETCTPTVMTSPLSNPLVDRFTGVWATPFQVKVAVIVAGKAALFFDAKVACTTGFWFTLP